MSRNKKRRIVCLLLLVMAIAVAAGITYYYFCWTKEPPNMRGGVLVHERYAVYADRQKC